MQVRGVVGRYCVGDEDGIAFVLGLMHHV